MTDDDSGDDRILGVIEAITAVQNQCPHAAVRRHATEALDAIKAGGAEALREQAFLVLATLAGWRGARADQVKRSHGSTSGQIDLEQLFYLMARGISERQARKLITLGFTHEVIDRLGDDDLVDECTALIDAKFAAFD